MRTFAFFATILGIATGVIAADSSYQFRIFNALSYPVKIGHSAKFKTLLKTIEPGNEIMFTKQNEYLYVERGIKGADPWEFNLGMQSFASSGSVVLVMTFAGLYVIPEHKFHPSIAENYGNITEYAIDRIVPLD